MSVINFYYIPQLGFIRLCVVNIQTLKLDEPESGARS